MRRRGPRGRRRGQERAGGGQQPHKCTDGAPRPPPGRGLGRVPERTGEGGSLGRGKGRARPGLGNRHFSRHPPERRARSGGTKEGAAPREPDPALPLALPGGQQPLPDLLGRGQPIPGRQPRDQPGYLQATFSAPRTETRMGTGTRVSRSRGCQIRRGPPGAGR